MSIQAVLFDIGNVLVAWRPEAFFDRMVGEARRKTFFDQVPVLAMNDLVDAGADLGESVAALNEAHPDFAEELDLWRDRYIEMIGPTIDGSVRILRALRRADVPVYALSNFGAESFTKAQREYPFLEEFDGRFISAEMGVAKPDPVIFERVEAELGLPPETLLFTDDRADNIAVAQARGWGTHLFDGPEGWAARLVAEQLLTEEAAQ